MQAIESGLALREDDAYAIALEPDDIALVDVGGVVVDLCFQPVPQKVVVPISERLDWTALNIFLLVFFFAGLLVVAAVTRAASGDEFTDELSGNNAVLTKLLVKPPEMQKNPFIEQLQQAEGEGRGAGGVPGHRGPDGQEERPQPRRQGLARRPSTRTARTRRGSSPSGSSAARGTPASPHSSAARVWAAACRRRWAT